MTESTEAAERTASSVSQCIQDGDYQSALQYYSGEFFEETSRDEWIAVLVRINEKFGDLQSWELDKWKTTNLVGTVSGTYVELTYHTRYAKYDATETIWLKRSGSLFTILGHNIMSEGLLAEE